MTAIHNTYPDSKEEKPLLAHLESVSNENAATLNSIDPYYSIRDSRDCEEDDDEDSSDLGYSDDSASLSDAYFYPQSDETDLLRPFRYRDQDPLHPVLASYYGAINSQDRGSSPLWKAESIQEDVEAAPTSAPLPWNADATVMTKKDKRKHRRVMKQQQRMHHKQREQAARERAVAQVRGQVQDVSSWQNVGWAILFVLQLVLVIGCALRFGFGVILFQEDVGWHQYLHPFSDHHRSLAHTSNATASQLFYSDSDAHSASLVDDGVIDINTIPKAQVLVQNDAFTIDYKNVIELVGVAGFYSCILTYLSFGFMLILARSLIQIMLVFSIIVSLAWGMIGLTLDPYGIISLMGFSALLLTLGYTMYNWNRIPFAATNLYTALCAMRCTADITILGLCSLTIAFAWCLTWTMAFIGIVNSFNYVDCDESNNCQPHVRFSHLPLYLALLFSFHWTNTVIKNVVRTTVASTIGTWWFSPGQISPFCSAAVARPLWRSLSRGLGSICLASLVVQPAQTAAFLGNCLCYLFGMSDSTCMPNNQHRKITRGREDNELGVVNDETTVDSAADTVGLCVRACSLITNMSRLFRCCNRYAFSYMGMYGYSFCDAGEKAIQLFETREWMDVVADNLIQNVLLMASLVIGGSAGVFAVVIEETDGYDFTSFHKPIVSAFVIGSVLGFVLSNVLLLGLVGSAVNTILVCFAAGPFEFDKNHPRLSREMREVWSQQVWEPPV